MDYPSFTGPPAFGGFPSAAAHSPPASLATQAPPPPQPPFQQSPQPFPYAAHGQFANGQAFASPGAMGGHGGAPMNAMMPQPMHPGGMHRAAAAMPQYATPNPFAHALPAPAHHPFAPPRQTASPSTAAPLPYAAPHLPPHHLLQHHLQPSPAPSPHHHPPPKTDPPQALTPVKTLLPEPVSPVAHARNQDRVATLLEINSILIKEICDLQAQGKAGHVAQPPDGKPDSDKPQPSKEYVDYMRRLQTNLTFLAQNAEKSHKPGQPVQPGPAIMSIPTGPPDIVKLYQKLTDLFPGWKGQAAQMKQSPGPQRLNSNASIVSQPPNSAGLQSNWSQNAMANMQQAQAQATKIEQ
ncbi:hypothetical protein ACEQ8H_001253 [Pleosporales sp. CAS-2024a]